MNVELISITKPEIQGTGRKLDTAEQLVAYCARVSNPSNQMNNETAPKLLQYLIKNKHWSPFEMVSMCVSIETSRAIAAQILRHRSFSFQEFSQRYAEAIEPEPFMLRKKAEKNRQSSTEDVENTYQVKADNLVQQSFDTYKWLIRQGVATESARMVLPLCTQTKIYMNGTLRSWIHYVQIRDDDHVQKEHREIAVAIRKIMNQQFPTVMEALK